MPVSTRFSFYISILFVLLIPFLTLQAESVDTLLNEFSQKNDSSRKTIDENRGHLFLYTREKLERMHARSLKDVLKMTPALKYNENRYAVPDPMGSMSTLPFASNLIRIYIDGVEVTHGWFGSGISLYGDMDISFADHIELYYGTPSFEGSPESAYMSVFIYSKDPSRDTGGSINGLYGSHAYNKQSFNYLDKIGDYSYMLSISRTDARGEKIANGTATPLSRNYKRTQLFGYIKNDNQMAHIQIIKKDGDSLAGMSWDATPERSKASYDSLHLDYKIDFNAHWSAKIAYNKTTIDSKQKDDNFLMFTPPFLGITSLDTVMESSSLTGEINYKNRLGNHDILAGIKVRKKEFVSYEANGVKMPLPDFNKETITTFFLQDQYSLFDKHLLSLGLSYAHIDRNGNMTDDDLWQARLGYIYAGETWSFKTYLYKILTPKDPVAINLTPAGNDPLVQESIGLTAELSYRDEKQSARLMLLGMKAENELQLEELLKLDPDIKSDYLTAIFNYSYSFDADNTLDLQLYYASMENRYLDYEEWGGIASLSNRHGSFEFYNSIIWNWDGDHEAHYFDLSSAVTWNATQDLSVTLKGENLLNRGLKNDIFRLNPTNGLPMPPLRVPISDRRVTLELEYTF